jgi:hypothetical protein
MRVSAVVAFVLLWTTGLSAFALDFSVHANTNKTLTAILATGPVEFGDADRLARFINDQPRRERIAVYLSSPGGKLYEGMLLGRMFKEWRIKTVVEGGADCASACALAFLGGHDNDGNPWRSSSDNSRLGFHSFSSPGGGLQDENETQRTVSDVLSYGHYVRAPLEILVLTFATPSYDIHWLSEEEICYLGIKLWSNRTDNFIC